MLFNVCVSRGEQAGECDMRKGMACTVMRRQEKRSEGGRVGRREGKTSFIFLLSMSHCEDIFLLNTHIV